MRPTYLQEHYSNADVATGEAHTEVLTAKGSTSRPYPRWIYGIIPGGGANAQHIDLEMDGLNLGNVDLQFAVERVGTVTIKPIIFPVAIFVPALQVVNLKYFHDKGTDEQGNVTLLFTRDAAPVGMKVGKLFTFRQSLTASDESLGGGTEVELLTYGKVGRTYDFVKCGAIGAGAATLLGGISSPSFDLTDNAGEAFPHFPGSPDVGLGDIYWPPSEPVKLTAGEKFTPKAMDISGGTVIWTAITVVSE